MYLPLIQKPRHLPWRNWPAWKRVSDFVHANSESKIAVQLAHAGRKGSLTRSWEGHKSLGEAKWELIAPSPLAFAEGRQVPREMTRADMDTVRDAFVRATEMSDAAGFDIVWYGIAPAIVYVGLGIAALGLLWGRPWGTSAIAAGLMALLLVSIHAEWDLVTYLAPIAGQPPPDHH